MKQGHLKAFLLHGVCLVDRGSRASIALPAACWASPSPLSALPWACSDLSSEIWPGFVFHFASGLSGRALEMFLVHSGFLLIWGTPAERWQTVVNSRMWSLNEVFGTGPDPASAKQCPASPWRRGGTSPAGKRCPCIRQTSEATEHSVASRRKGNPFQDVHRGHQPRSGHPEKSHRQARRQSFQCSSDLLVKLRYL